MPSVAEHYARHLAPIYLWMAGGAEIALQSGAAEVAQLGLPLTPGAYVVDLGAGFGLHAIPLARRGARVTAIDSSPELLRTLEQLRADLPVEAVTDDLLAFDRHLMSRPTAILCMGDTLLHLPARADVDTLIEKAAAALPAGGMLVLSFRDYTQTNAGGLSFIPVRSDARRILTCCVEYEADRVRVHDVIHERTAEGWQMRVSHYVKLRLRPRDVMASIDAYGFNVRREAGLRGMVRLLATRR